VCRGKARCPRGCLRMEHFADRHHLVDVQAIADVAAYSNQQSASGKGVRRRRGEFRGPRWDPDRSVAIQGYTGSVGSEDYNQGLSERRQLGEGLSGRTRDRFSAALRIGQGSERPGSRQRFRSRPAAEPSRRGDHQQPASGIEIAIQGGRSCLGRSEPGRGSLRGLPPFLRVCWYSSHSGCAQPN
jgi:hypothetical protein